MKDNEKAAIAGGQWVDREQVCDAHVCLRIHNWNFTHEAPDMHDPRLLFSPEETEARFKALVARYDAEHPK